ncbi:cysteine desulfurase family protein [Gloeocapsa sp. PCC 73106]|uniref:cysteine desulfurase family protein n=1 Tax=Gloeocapsa sp. PCC 73106 TaxID=102232 RepID=UPI0002ACD68B|nr:cysteine desulfurase family protein [Gloeocapsa sp. PCC 73106]ELR99215.1 cysteine desulfurase family protein [Gloeocapsa sp. PCC 73106]
MQIYLDYSATTKPCPEAIAKMEEIFQAQWGNPSSLHFWGNRAATVIEQARIQVAELINAPAEAIVFTSGGTEANNLALFGVAKRYSFPQHLIISSIEHPAVAEPARILQESGWQVTKLPVNQQGRINPLDLSSAIRPNTVLASVIYGQSEVGTIQPLAELAQIARNQGILFHTDAVQAAGRLAIDLEELPIDLLSLSSHKLYGPQGVGALYIRPGVRLKPHLLGGGQESGLRPGTQPVAIIGGFGEAAKIAKQELSQESQRLEKLRDRLYTHLTDCPYLIPTGDRIQRLPHHLSFILNPRLLSEKITGKTLVRQLNLAGIGISSGSACQSGKLNPSPVLLAMGYSPTEAIRGIRLTLGRDTVSADVDWTAMVIKQILERIKPQLLTV